MPSRLTRLYRSIVRNEVWFPRAGIWISRRTLRLIYRREFGAMRHPLY